MHGCKAFSFVVGMVSFHLQMKSSVFSLQNECKLYTLYYVSCRKLNCIIPTTLPTFVKIVEKLNGAEWKARFKHWLNWSSLCWNTKKNRVAFTSKKNSFTCSVHTKQHTLNNHLITQILTDRNVYSLTRFGVIQSILFISVKYDQKLATTIMWEILLKVSWKVMLCGVFTFIFWG